MVTPTKPGYYASHPEKSSEYVLLQLSKHPDSVKAIRAKHKLLVCNEGFLVDAIADWVKLNPRCCFSELLQEARLAFLKAVDNYNLSRGVSIRTFARYHLMKVKETFFQKQIYVGLNEEDLDEVCLQPDLGTDYLDLCAILSEAMSYLSSAEQEVIQLHFFHGLKKRAIAVHRRCSEQRISALHKSALRKLREYLTGRGIQPGMFNLN